MARGQLYIISVQKLYSTELRSCVSRGGCPGLPVPDKPYGLCGRKATLEEALLLFCLLFFFFFFLFLLSFGCCCLLIVCVCKWFLLFDEHRVLLSLTLWVHSGARPPFCLCSVSTFWQCPLEDRPWSHSWCPNSTRAGISVGPQLLQQYSVWLYIITFLVMPEFVIGTLSHCSAVIGGHTRMSDVTPLSGISGLSFDSPFLSPLLFFFCL